MFAMEEDPEMFMLRPACHVVKDLVTFFSSQMQKLKAFELFIVILCDKKEIFQIK